MTSNVSGLSAAAKPAAVAVALLFLVLFSVYYWRHHKAKSQQNLKNKKPTSGSGPEVRTPESIDHAKRIHLSLEDFMGCHSSENYPTESMNISLEDVKINEIYTDNLSEPNVISLDDFRAAFVPTEQGNHNRDSL